MRRRDFISLIGGAATSAWPIAARAQKSAKVPRIGIIDDAPTWEHFRQGLRDLGYIDGQNIAFEYRSGEGQPDRLATAANDLARLPVDVIVTAGSAATRAAQQATVTIPIVMISVGDPVRAGFVASLARPGGNVTGNTILGTEMSAKRLQLFKELIPGLLRVAFLWNPNNLSHLAYLEEWRTVAPALDVKLIFVEVRSSDQFDSAFAAMMQQRPDGFLMTADIFHLSHIGLIIDFMAENRLPAMYIVKENVIAGGLISYGPNLPDLYRRSAEYVHKILQGTRPTDLPVEQPTKFELVINLKSAKALGLTVPESFLLRADQLIE
jgi:putative tryptophan/tyrosine transport system substrate-binding protein